MTSLYKFYDWIDQKKLDWCYLSQNPNAIDILEQNFKEIRHHNLCKNPNAIHLINRIVDSDKARTVL